MKMGVIRHKNHCKRAANFRYGVIQSPWGTRGFYFKKFVKT